MTIKMRRPLRSLVLAALLLATFALSSSSSLAGVLIGVGTDPPLPMEFSGNNELQDMIMVGTESNPVPVVPEPTGPAWMKFFTINRDGQGWSPTGTNSMVSVMEFIRFTPSTTSVPFVVDWHEDIDPTFGEGGSFKWAGGEIVTPAGAFPGSTSTDGKSIWFNFPPVPIGAPIKITKNLMWTGGVITPGPNGQNNYRIKINERPSIPEPSAMAFIGSCMALAPFGLRRRSHR
jgi:hypothetical protein